MTRVNVQLFDTTFVTEVEEEPFEAAESVLRRIKMCVPIAGKFIGEVDTVAVLFNKKEVEYVAAIM